MRYLYKCNSCKIEEVVDKPMKFAGEPELCMKCSKPMGRVYHPPSIKTSDGTKS